LPAVLDFAHGTSVLAESSNFDARLCAMCQNTIIEPCARLTD